MILRQGRSVAMAGLIGTALLGAACAPVRDRQGYVMDAELANAVQVGVDNRESVAGTLGRPTFVGQFDQRDWYYVSRNTRNLAFNMPRAVEQTVLHIRFDEAGNVAAINRTGIDQVVAISPSGDETPTLGRERGFFEELFGNIGTVGQTGQPTTTTDNPG